MSKLLIDTAYILYTFIFKKGLKCSCHDYLPVHILQLMSKMWLLCSAVVSLSMLLKMSGTPPPPAASGAEPGAEEDGAELDSSWS